jgi:hypothetical protein
MSRAVDKDDGTFHKKVGPLYHWGGKDVKKFLLFCGRKVAISLFSRERVGYSGPTKPGARMAFRVEIQAHTMVKKLTTRGAL